MNILVEQLPEAVEIEGIEYAINTDFRACLRAILACEDPELTPEEKQALTLENLYPDQPHNLGKALEQAIKFLNGGEIQDESDGPRLYSFSKDARFIFAAFRQTHGIDLESAELHWWKFLALFMDLGSDTAFCNLISLRKRIKNGKASKEERRAYQEMKDLVDLPDTDHRTLEEREQEQEFLRLVSEARRQRDGGL